MSDPDVLHGGLHNMILAQSRDSAAASRDMPSLMASMLRENGWRVLVRPKDGKRFEHDTIADWVLGPAWGGLDWPNWETLYGVLRTNAKDGPEVLRLLQEAGAPPPKDVDRKFLVESTPKLPEHGKIGRGRNRGDIITSNGKRGTSAAYLVSRLKREAPAIAAKFATGGFRSARDAAMAAGIIKPQPVERPGALATKIVARGEAYAREVILEIEAALGRR
jgi:hypothetical protein